MLLDDFNLAALIGLGATSVGVIADMMRVIFFFLDSIVYSLIPVVYRGIFALYDIDKIIGVGNTQNLLNTAKETVYSFLAIFMFFRVAFSLITMLVDPSLIDDKSKGAKKIVLNIFICLGLIVVVPVFFRVAKNIQTRVLEEKIIERAVGGDIYSNDQNYNLGNELALSTWSVFLQPVVDEGDAYDAWKGVFESGNPTIWPLPVLATHLNDTTGGILGGLATKIAGVAAILRATGTVTYQLGYIWLISGLVGIYVVWTMIKLLIDVAYRSIKFLLLEVISPIAIISYIDPKSSEKGLFSKWLSETLKTYLSLFIRIFIFAMVSVILKQISVSSFFDEGNILTRLFFILALVAFMKTAPKFIDNLFGTEISKGSDTKFASDLLRGGLGAIGGAATGAIGGAVVAGRKNLPMGRSVWEGAKKGLTGGFSSARKGSFMDYGKNLISGASGQAAREYFGLAKEADERKALRTKERAEAASDTYDALKSSFGYKDAPDAMTKATKLADAFRTKGIRFDPVANAKDKELNKALLDADEADLKDASLMTERGKVLDTALAYRKLVDDGTISQDMADKLTMQAIRKYNKLAASKHYARAKGDLNDASARAIQLEVSYDGKSATELQSIVTSKQLSNYQEILGMSVSGISGIENMSVADIERTLRITISDDKREKINNIRNKSNTLRTTVDKKEISEFVADIDKFTEKAVAADGVSGKSEALLGKANAAVDEEMKISSKSSEFIKRVQLGDKYRGR
jgi:hypothetical protein